MLCDNEYLAIFIDNTLLRKYQCKQISQKMTTLLYQSLIHKLMTPINSLVALTEVVHSQIPAGYCSL